MSMNCCDSYSHENTFSLQYTQLNWLTSVL